MISFLITLPYERKKVFSNFFYKYSFLTLHNIIIYNLEIKKTFCKPQVSQQFVLGLIINKFKLYEY